MSPQEKLHTFRYKYLQGPVSFDELRAGPEEGNCRLAVQDYFLRMHGIFLSRSEVVLPDAFQSSGEVVGYYHGDKEMFVSNMRMGDVIYAERYKDSRGRRIKQKKNLSYEEWMINLHTAVYLGNLSDEVIPLIPGGEYISRHEPTVWHASFISGGTAVWTLNQFMEYYHPVLAKRILI